MSINVQKINSASNSLQVTANGGPAQRGSSAAQVAEQLNQANSLLGQNKLSYNFNASDVKGTQLPEARLSAIISDPASQAKGDVVTYATKFSEKISSPISFSNKANELAVASILTQNVAAGVKEESVADAAARTLLSDSRLVGQTGDIE